MQITKIRASCHRTTLLPEHLKRT